MNIDDLTRRLGTISMRSETSFPQLPTEVHVLILRNLSLAHLRLVCRRICRIWREAVDNIVRERLVGRCCAWIDSAQITSDDMSIQSTTRHRSYLTCTSVDCAGKVILCPDTELMEFESGGPIDHSISTEKLWEDVIFTTPASRDLLLPFFNHNAGTTSGPFTVKYRWEDAWEDEYVDWADLQYGIGDDYTTTITCVVFSVEISLTDLLAWEGCRHITLVNELYAARVSARTTTD
ncbi:hypothetical protein HKX48_002338 [Thoreauomyces humboldtii]|nr:hypothetical protein HKX48_002338 [Thoreauomyces humboldtii]